MISRRTFFRASGFTIGALGTAPSWLLRAAAPTAANGKALVAVFQRGAADGLNIVVPFFEKRRTSCARRLPCRLRGRRTVRSISTADSASIQRCDHCSLCGRPAISQSCTLQVRPTPRARTSTPRPWSLARPAKRSTRGWLNRALPDNAPINQAPCAPWRWARNCLSLCGAPAAPWPSTTCRGIPAGLGADAAALSALLIVERRAPGGSGKEDVRGVARDRRDEAAAIQAGRRRAIRW